MGRKIPGRKHRGIRDPEKQAAARFESIKDKINAPPLKPDEQQISKSLQRFIDLKNKVKSGTYHTKHLKKSPSEDGKSPKKNKNEAEVLKAKQAKRIPTFKQAEGESDRDFVKRINRICMDVTREAAYEEKYGVEIRRNEDGEVEGVVKRPKDELELYLKKLKKDQNSNKKKKKKNNEKDSPRLSKWQKRQKKLKLKKMDKNLFHEDDIEKYKDTIKFGEVAHAPPSLITPRKVGTQQNAPRPGNKNLLLNSILQPKDLLTKSTSVPTQKESLRKISNNVIDRKGKRKDLPNALRRQLEKQQKEIIGAYKELKANKYSGKS
ncbi:coiled-coil domain-containing protein 137 [Leptinotarsa decemlineata]|uniref:coiled-coil domain-containing protein 137 n=1 Tax=Leptinotarsa decemlineata TaxID=7539 RepID=UPI003D30B0DB